MQYKELIGNITVGYSQNQTLENALRVVKKRIEIKENCTISEKEFQSLSKGISVITYKGLDGALLAFCQNYYEKKIKKINIYNKYRHLPKAI